LANAINKSVLAIAAPRRYRNREHLRQSGTANSSLALRSHHRAVHRAGNERAWWKAAGIDPVKVAGQLWRQTRLNDPQDPHQPRYVAQQACVVCGRKPSDPHHLGFTQARALGLVRGCSDVT
jgi:hypothetical protein